jgi:hypothetical protein
VPVDERNRDLGAVEQTGAHLVLDDAALGEHPDHVQVVDREPGIAPDRGAREAGIRPVDLTAEHDVPVVVREEELLAVLPRDPPDRREPRRLPIEMRPHGGGQVLGHGRSRLRMERRSLQGARCFVGEAVHLRSRDMISEADHATWRRVIFYW